MLGVVPSMQLPCKCMHSKNTWALPTKCFSILLWVVLDVYESKIEASVWLMSVGQIKRLFKRTHNFKPFLRLHVHLYHYHSIEELSSLWLANVALFCYVCSDLEKQNSTNIMVFIPHNYWELHSNRWKWGFGQVLASLLMTSHHQIVLQNHASCWQIRLCLRFE